AGPSQFLARQLIAALLMITASAASFVPNLAHLGASAPPPAKMPISHSAAQLPGAHPRAAISAAPHGSAGSYNLPALRGGGVVSNAGLRVASNSQLPATLGETKLYRVQPPHGRHHDTLWEIAQRHLGDGRRYREIFELNEDRVQPDGSQLTHASLIRPGWILTMPADATGGDLVVEPPPISAPSAPSQGSTTPNGPTAPTGPENLSPAPPTGVPHASPNLSSQAPTTPVTPTQGSPTQGSPTQGSPTQGSTTQSVPTASAAPSVPVFTSPSALTPVPPNASAPFSTQTPTGQDPTQQAPSTQAPTTQAPVTSNKPPALAAANAQADAPQDVSAAHGSSTDAQPADAAPDDVVLDNAQPADSDVPAAQPAAIAQSGDELARLASAAAAAATEGDDTTPTLTIPVSAPAPDDAPAQAADPADIAVTADNPGTADASTTSDTSAAASVGEVLANAPILRPRTTPVIVKSGPSVTSASALTPVDRDRQGTTKTAGRELARPSHRGAHAPEESQAPST
ncbi:MAG: hypothetical protein ACRDSS_15465, partial [Actinocrinis sp.]